MKTKMKMMIVLWSLILAMNTSWSTESGTCAAPAENADPYDNFIDPATCIDYNQVWGTIGGTAGSGPAYDMVLNKCIMFTIQADMAGVSNEQSMSPADIDAYEKMVEQECICAYNKKKWVRGSGTSNRPPIEGTCRDFTSEELKGVSVTGTENPTAPDLFVYTQNRCMDQMGVTQSECNPNGGTKASEGGLDSTCVVSLRRQCHDYILQPQEFWPKTNIADADLGKCSWEDQTKIIKLECRSYCYQKQICEIGGTDDGNGNNKTTVGASEGTGALSAEALAALMDEFKKRKISNIYLMDQKSRSSCVKDSSFGLEDVNKIWVNNSCHANFGIQFKDPKCGFRPHCPIKTHEVQNDNLKGLGVAKLECNGQTAQLTTSNKLGRMFCKLWPTKDPVGTNEAPAAIGAERDENKVVTNIKTIAVLEKKAGSCNSGGNSSAIEYAPIKMSEFNSDGVATTGTSLLDKTGWGVFVENGCHAIFKVTYDWEVANCLKAGELIGANGASNCCMGLDKQSIPVIINGTKSTQEICQSPITLTEVPRLTDPEQLGLGDSGRYCEKVIISSIKARAKGYMKEFALYENLFSMLDNKLDKITKLRSFDTMYGPLTAEMRANMRSPDMYTDESTVYVLKPGERLKWQTIPSTDTSYTAPLASQYDILRDLHDAYIDFRNQYNTTMLAWNEANRKIEEDYIYFTEQTQLLQQSKTTVDAILAGRPTLDPIFKMLDETGNPVLLDGKQQLADSQMVASRLQLDGAIRDQIVTTGIAAGFETLSSTLWLAVQKSANIVWLCAHSDNCSAKNWLEFDQATKDASNSIIEYLHDPPHAYLSDEIQNLIQYAFIAPPLNGVDKYYLKKGFVTGNSEFGRWLGSFTPYRRYFNFSEAAFYELPPEENPTEMKSDLWKIFLRYTLEVPLRDDSPFKTDSYLNAFTSNYTEGREGEGSASEYKFTKDNEKSLPLPYYCQEMVEVESEEAANRIAYDVRLPIGKLIEVVRAHQLSAYFYDYYTRYYLAIYDEKIQCLSDNAGAGGNGISGTADTVPLGTPIVSATGAITVVGASGATAGMFAAINAAIPSFGAVSSSHLGGNNGSTVGTTGTGTTLGTGGTLLSALRAKSASDRAGLLSRAKLRGDGGIAKHLNSLESTLSQALVARGLSSSTPSTGANSALASLTNFGGAGNAVNADGSGSGGSFFEERLKNRQGNAGGGHGGGGRGNSGKGGSDSGTSIGGSAQASRMDDGMAREINDPRFNPHPDDTIWQAVTKRYIRTGYPILLQKLP